MWPVLIIVFGVRLHDVVQLPETEAEEVIQALPLQAADPRLGVTIGDGRLNRRPDNTAVGSLKMLIEGFGEFRIPVADQEPHIDPLVLGPHADVPGLLLKPFAERIVRARRHEDLPAA